MKEIDVRKLACPGPVLELRRLLDAGETALRLMVADELARSNVSRFAASRGALVESEAALDGGFAVAIDASGIELAPVSDEEVAAFCEPSGAPRGPLVVQLSSDCMGLGDDELGRLLMRGFLKTQIQLERRPDQLIFYNSGVRLCCEGSVLIEDLHALEKAGVEIIACGTCLNFFELAEKLQVGRVTDLLEIGTLLGEAGHIVRP